MLPIDVMLPAPGQGVIALQIRDDDAHTRDTVAQIDHPPTGVALRAERALLRTLGAGCAVPIGGLAHLRAGEVSLLARAIDITGRRVIGRAGVGPRE